MRKNLSVAEFYSCHSKYLPDNIRKEVGHFNVFKVSDMQSRCSSFGRKEFYTIILVKGRCKYHYAEQTVTVEDNTLVFCTPDVPYELEPVTMKKSGMLCIFTADFFSRYGGIQLQEYPVFSAGAQSFYKLTPARQQEVVRIFHKMFAEISTDYLYKYDVLRNCVLDLVHEASKLQPEVSLLQHSNAAARIAAMFTELLERQFPVASLSQQIALRTPGDFAEALSIHVNHLNKALKEITGKTTSALIAERIIQEARLLLKRTQWNVSEIANCLGFEELPHFIHFFRKNVQMTPAAYRK
ncbi:helix-turn-helix domain-containing protein [Chitinophaga nivalis]|uniref:Helix-turn-helix transcriptional regulator n=1 Tax=Chitinophaga nivalis TaxID=2991709 RepID=A0ABT3ITE3_9BACT|nr:helix-turn-helix transcriptional regulator [Chitinophaga nivalis]MCW3463149.1 helix-turn-helix transcriptional regulator [Chitinophaga nivalis]MCW3487161.1 helix-turn-helix transcriptional regulator [Chitinophaga nivalis]